MTENTAIPDLTDEEVEQRTEDILEAMRDVVDPELGINVVDLGLVYGVLLDGPDKATLDMTLTSAACPLTDVIEEQTAEALKDTLGDFSINWVWMPPWGPPARSQLTGAQGRGFPAWGRALRVSQVR
jgi:metal-sulfur cluster biosynthetic enzyme